MTHLRSHPSLDPFNAGSDNMLQIFGKSNWTENYQEFIRGQSCSKKSSFGRQNLYIASLELLK